MATGCRGMSRANEVRGRVQSIGRIVEAGRGRRRRGCDGRRLLAKSRQLSGQAIYLETMTNRGQRPPIANRSCRAWSLAEHTIASCSCSSIEWRSDGVRGLGWRKGSKTDVSVIKNRGNHQLFAILRTYPTLPGRFPDRWDRAKSTEGP